MGIVSIMLLFTIIPKMYFWINDYKEGTSDHLINIGIICTIFQFFTKRLNTNWKTKGVLTVLTFIYEIYLLGQFRRIEFWENLIIRVTV